MTIGKASNVEFRQGKAEELGFLGEGEVDMVVVGQAAHWFNLDKLWAELGRVVKRGGTLAIWGYKDNIIVGQPLATKIYDEFTYSEKQVAPGMESMNAYWEKPGRDLIRELTRDTYEPNRETCTVSQAEAESAWLQRRMRLGEFEGYVRSFSAYRGWKDAHQEAKSRAEGGSDGDVVDVMFDHILDAVPAWKELGPERWREAEIDAVWGTVLIVARKL
jgi:SAM-dependent methyltransferase